MEWRGAYLRVAGVAVVVGVLLILAAATFRQVGSGVAQAQANAPLLSTSYDVWEAGKLRVSRERGPYPMGESAVTADIQIDSSEPPTYTVINIVGSAPLTTTVAEARVLLERQSPPLANTFLELGVCKGADIVRVISSAPVDVGIAPERTWLDIPLVEAVNELTIDPSQYLCYIGRRTSATWVDIEMVLQAAVRYWAAPTDYVYLSDIRQ